MVLGFMDNGNSVCQNESSVYNFRHDPIQEKSRTQFHIVYFNRTRQCIIFSVCAVYVDRQTSVLKKYYPDMFVAILCKYIISAPHLKSGQIT